MSLSAYPMVKQHLVDRLSVRGGLAGVRVSYQEPEQRDDLQGDTGQYEAVFCAGAEGSLDVQIFTDGTAHHWAEDFHLDVIAQVLDATADQRAVDERCTELVAEVLSEIGSLAFRTTLETFMSDFDRITVTPAAQRWVPGYLPGTTGGHGARCELALRVEARRAY